MLERKIYSVSRINRYIKGVLENDVILSGVWVKGEVSNCKYHSSGHIYFTLKDSDSAVNCIMFKGDAINLPFIIENGMSIIIYCYVSLYEKTGQYQLYAQIAEPAGVGALTVAYEQLKERLSKEGLFDDDFKRPICKYPKKIAVITSPTGAAIRDVINISSRRNPAVEIVVVPVLVQGERAAETIVSAIKDVNKWNEADTIILCRGGGSIEDLWCFNEESVARAIFASNIPVISAVGHETDFTISDFVSDLRAPTPSAAAELAVNNIYDDIAYLENIKQRVEYAAEKYIENKYSFIDWAAKSISFREIDQRLSHEEMRLDNTLDKINQFVQNKLEKNESYIYSLMEKMEILSPMSVLKRGYSVLYDSDNKAVMSVSDIKKDSVYSLKMKDGKAYMTAQGVIYNGQEENDI